MLAAIGRAAKSVLRENDLAFKGQGNEFIFNFSGLKPEDIVKIQARIQKQLADDVELQALLREQRELARQNLQEAMAAGDAKKIKRWQDRVESPHLQGLELRFQTLMQADLPENPRFTDMTS